MTEEIDFEADAEAIVASDDALAAVDTLVKKQLQLEADVAELEDKLKAKKKDLRKVQERELPDALEAANIGKFETADGVSVSVKEDITLSIAGNKKQIAINWLSEIGSSDLVTHEIVVPFGKGKDNEMGDFKARLEELGIGYSDVTNLNTTSLKALVRKRIEAGEEVPLEELGGFQWRKAQIKL